jgi:hypothetical protein
MSCCERWTNAGAAALASLEVGRRVPVRATTRAGRAEFQCGLLTGAPGYANVTSTQPVMSTAIPMR